MKTIQLIVGSFVFLMSMFSQANEWIIKGGDVHFTAVGKPGFLKINGTSKDKFPTGSIQFQKNGQASVNIDFKLDDLDTGIELRNKHMKEKYLDTKQFPIASLKIESFVLDESKLKENFSEFFSGEMLLHGIKKKVNGKYKYNASDRKIEAQMNLSLKDFDIETPNYMGVSVAEKVEINSVLIIEKKP